MSGNGEGREQVSETGRTRNWRTATRLVRGGLQRSGFGETSEALYLTSGFRYDSAEAAEARFRNEEPGFVYSRFGNPTVATFEDRLAAIEGAEAAKAVASGMAAVNAALMCQLKAGDHVLAARALFGSCRYIIEDILPRFGVETTLIDGADLDLWRSAIRPNTACIFLETPSNPTLEIVDLAAVAAIARSVGARVIVDNVFATPILQKPLELGADIVVYSATKHIDGQGRCLGGAILGRRDFIENTLTPYLRHTGPSLSPFNAWVMLKGLETLDLRIRQHCRNAAEIADFLAGLAPVERVIYPFRPDHPQQNLARAQMELGGAVVSFEVAGGKAGAFGCLNRLRLIDISNNLGDAKSLICHPGTTTHQRLPAEERRRLGIGDGLLRLSVGLEDLADLKEDLAQALAA
ncbi:MAG: O-succinylhomoserine sulfhydrylase [Alphaproteobacteria bacterium]|nr:O-succinylhomoserine sulfhydrylase [Alphaproteobacteria bacterium]